MFQNRHQNHPKNSKKRRLIAFDLDDLNSSQDGVVWLEKLSVSGSNLAINDAKMPAHAHCPPGSPCNDFHLRPFRIISWNVDMFEKENGMGLSKMSIVENL